MSDSRKIVKVFLASPGDLAEERQTARAAVDEFNNLWADHLGYQVELVGWEDTTPNFGRPQALINQDLEQCELFVGILWKRWGTLPAKSGPYTSGFHEEYSLCLARREATGKPEISIYFKHVDSDLLRDPGEDLRKVLAFREQVIAEKKLLFEAFRTTSDFRERLHLCLARYIQRLEERDSRGESDERQIQSASNVDPSSSSDVESGTPVYTPLSQQGAKFLAEFLEKAEGDLAEKITATEVARFRLLGTLVGARGNSDDQLGIHDANILFINKTSLDLGAAELRGLVRSACSHYSFHSAPLWCWLRLLGGGDLEKLSMYTVGGSVRTRVGAFAAMKLIGELPHTDGALASYFDKDFFLRSWLSEDEANEVKAAALQYLAEWGDPEALPFIRAELARNSYQTAASAVAAILEISFRDNAYSAVHALNELQPETVRAQLLEDIFASSELVDVGTLSPCLSHKCASVRQIATKTLKQRGELTAESATTLLQDGDAKVRYEALLGLQDLGQGFTLKEARGLLVKASSGLDAFFAAPDRAGEEVFGLFKRRYFMRMSDKQLEEVANAEAIFERDAFFIQMERKFESCRADLCASVDNQFRAEVENAIDDLTQRLGEASTAVEKAKASSEEARKNLTRKALDVICRRGTSNELLTVRTALAAGFIEHSEVDIEYLQRCGDWNDISLIVSLIERSNRSRGLLIGSADDDRRNRRAAHAIHMLGRLRFDEVVRVRMPSTLRAYVVLVASDSSFRTLTDSTMLSLFKDEWDNVRKATVAKAVHAFPKPKLSSLLEQYISSGTRYYYNVVHWLDFGVSVPEDRSTPAISRQAKQLWEA